MSLVSFTTLCCIVDLLILIFQGREIDQLVIKQQTISIMKNSKNNCEDSKSHSYREQFSLGETDVTFIKCIYFVLLLTEWKGHVW